MHITIGNCSVCCCKFLKKHEGREKLHLSRPFNKISSLKPFKKTGHLQHMRVAYIAIHLAMQSELLKGRKQAQDFVICFHSSKRSPMDFQRVCAGINADSFIFMYSFLVYT